MWLFIDHFSDQVHIPSFVSIRSQRLQYDRTIMADDFSDYVVDAGGLLVKFAFSFGSKAASAAKNAAKDVIYRARSKARKS